MVNEVCSAQFKEFSVSQSVTDYTSYSIVILQFEVAEFSTTFVSKKQYKRTKTYYY